MIYVVNFMIKPNIQTNLPSNSFAKCLLSTILNGKLSFATNWTMSSFISFVSFNFSPCFFCTSRAYLASISCATLSCFCEWLSMIYSLNWIEFQNSNNSNITVFKTIMYLHGPNETLNSSYCPMFRWRACCKFCRQHSSGHQCDWSWSVPKCIWFWRWLCISMFGLVWHLRWMLH